MYEQPEEIDVTNLDDASRHYGLSYAPDRAETIDTQKPLAKTVENPTLQSEHWLEHNNRRLEAEAKAAGEPLPPLIVIGPNGTIGIEDRNIEQQRRDELRVVEKERPDLPYPEQVNLARDRVSARQQQSFRNQGAYDDVRAEQARVTEEYAEMPLRDRQRLAVERVEARRLAGGGTDRMDGGKKPVDPDAAYLGDSIENLMRPGVEPEHSGSRKGKRPAIARVGADAQSNYDRMLGEAV